MTPLQFLAAVLASYRATRVIAIDTIFDGTRDRIKLWGINRNSTPGDKLTELIGCPWCVGVWVSIAVACVIRRRPPWRLGLDGAVTAAAIAGGQAMLSATEGLVVSRTKYLTTRERAVRKAAKLDQ